MKILTHAELWAMPEGTIFSEWDVRGHCALWRKDTSMESIHNCFFAMPICATVDFSQSGDTPLLEWCGHRFADFESAKEYVVYEQTDLEIIRQMLGTKAQV